MCELRDPIYVALLCRQNGGKQVLHDLPKRIAFQYLRRSGIEVRRARKHPSLIDFIEHHGINTVYDVGANVGQFGLSLRRRGYKGRIISFEPVSSEASSLRRVASQDGNWIVHQCAIGAEHGEARINVSENTQFSSLLSLSDAAPSIDPQSKIVGRERVECRTLDSFNVSVPCIIKIDTQGFEREVLKGASATLERTVGVLMELPIVDVYKGSWSFSEAIQTMGGLGFVPCQIDPVNHHHQDAMAAIEFDCLFRRKTQEIDQ
jgi:FkbM family methyltransferase